MREYELCADLATSVDFSDKKSVRRFNELSSRMRTIVDEVARLGHDAVLKFASLLEKEPASAWVAHHLVEKANLDSATLSKCFTRVSQARSEAEAKGDFANAMGEEMWLNEWQARKG